MRLVSLIGCVLTAALGCGAAPPLASEAPPPAAPPPVPAPSSSVQAPLGEASPDAAQAAPPPAVEVFVALPLPASFFDPKVELSALFPEQAKLIGGDAATLVPRATQGAGAYRPMLMRYAVIEAQEPVYRLACDTTAVRIALYLPGDALATVARRSTVLTPGPATGSTQPPQVGVHLEPGARVTALQAASGPEGRVRVQYKGLFIEADAFADPTAIGRAFLPAERAPDPAFNGELLADVKLIEGPGGEAFASITKPPDVVNRLLVHTFGPAKDGLRKIQYFESEASVVGWIEAARVKDIPPPPMGSGGFGSGSGSGGLENPISLPAGTRLRAPNAAPDAAIGVLLRDKKLSCVSGCESDAPTVEVYACGTTVEVVAITAAAR